MKQKGCEKWSEKWCEIEAKSDVILKWKLCKIKPKKVLRNWSKKLCEIATRNWCEIEAKSDAKVKKKKWCDIEAKKMWNFWIFGFLNQFYQKFCKLNMQNRIKYKTNQEVL